MPTPEGFVPARKEAHIEAVREGLSVPTPEFAMEEGGEMLDALKKEIEGLDEQQLASLRDALVDIGDHEPKGSIAEKIKWGSKIPSALAALVVVYLTDNVFAAATAGTATSVAFNIPLSTRRRNLMRIVQAVDKAEEKRESGEV